MKSALQVQALRLEECDIHNFTAAYLSVYRQATLALLES